MLNLKQKKAAVIGSGFSSLSAAAYLAKAGLDVTVYEKNPTIGGRARKFEADGFTFDMGPSWYWMPDVFESFFNDFGKSASNFYDLKLLSPSYAIYFGENDVLKIPSTDAELADLFESIEPGSSKFLQKFLEEAKYKYTVGMQSLVHKPGKSLLEFLDLAFLKGIFKMHVFQSMSAYVRKYFKDSRLVKLMEFPVLFLGGMPENTPALYSLMNYAGLSLGTWYPMGGMHKIIDAMAEVAKSYGVKFETGTPISGIDVERGLVTNLRSNGSTFPADAVVAGADYHHVEQNLLSEKFRTYNENYWDKRVMAPSSLIFFVGLNKKLQNIEHHNLFFDSDFKQHAQEIYRTPAWPKDPLFYVCCTSKTDPSVAPEGHENLFILIPLAPNLAETPETIETYFDIVMKRLEKLIGESVQPHVIYKKSFCISDFKNEYNAYKGNAYGLANTLLQTAIFKPAMHSKKVKNLFYTGQLTVPGPGVPPSIISGKVVAGEVIKSFGRQQ